MRSKTKLFIIRWTNRLSGETGYVGSIQKRKKYFCNADAKHALCLTEKNAEEAIEVLKTLSDAADNDYCIVNTAELC